MGIILEFSQEKMSEEKEKEVQPENEIRVSGSSYGLAQTIDQCLKLFKEKELEEIVISGLGSAIVKAVNTAEIVKRRIPNLHQWTKLNSEERPTNDPEKTRSVPAIKIHLQKQRKPVEQGLYQEPLTVEVFEAYNKD